MDRVLVAICIIIMTIATIAGALHLAPQLAPGRIVYDLAPDRPPPFGYKMAWLAIRSRDTQHIINTLAISDIEPANWDTGLGIVYSPDLAEDRLFVSPPVNGWTFGVGLALPHPLGRSFVDKAMPLLVGIGGEFIEVQYFYSYPPIDLFAWARMIDGRLVRAFAVGDEGVLWSKGKLTKEEKMLDLKLFELRGMRGRKGDAGGPIVLYPTEDHIMRLAAKWSIDPTRIDQVQGEPAFGYVGRAPRGWRAERVRKAAA